MAGRAYAAAIVAVGLATLVRYVFDTLLGAPFLYSTYFPAIVAAAALGGLRPGTLAVGLSAVAAWWALPGTHGAMDQAAVAGLGLFALNGMLVTIVCERVRRADLSLQRSLERERFAHQRSAEVLENMSDGYYTVDSEWRITYVNKTASVIMSLSPESLIGRNLWEAVPPIKDSVFEREYRRGAALREVVHVESATPDSPFWFEASAYPAREGGMRIFFRDISARKNAENALKDSEERLRLGTEAGQIGTWDWDIVKDHVTWSDRVYEFHGMKKGEFGGQVADFVKVLHPEDVERVRSAIDASIADQTPYQVEFRVVHPGGEIRWLTTAGQVFYEDGAPTRMRGAITDITKRRAAEAERDRLLASERAARADAERVNRIKDEFLANLSHELRTPLNAILGWAQILTAAKPKGELAQGLAVIERNARAQTELISDLLDMSRVLSGKLKVDAVVVKLAPVIEAALEAIAPAAAAKAITVEKVLDPDAEVIGDADRLQQVAWNLLTNAIKFTPKGGRVKVGASAAGAHFAISVEDDGIGIDPGFLPFVFDRFRQADASTTRQHGGLGLGLAIVKNLVELHGGRISVVSPRPGHHNGSIFSVELPVPSPFVEHTVPPPRLTGVPLEDGVRDAVLEGFDILIVDDDSDAREVLRRLLETCRARVRSAPTAALAMAAVREARPQLVVADIAMPDEDGYALIRQLHAEAGPRIPAIALTAFARAEDQAHTTAAGFALHLPKPVEPSELIAAVLRVGRPTVP